MKESILILVKTYPTFSKKYFELVCTAGINQMGKWRRVYPIPFRELRFLEKYKKYQWVEMDLIKNESDPRPESYKLKENSEINLTMPVIGTQDNWKMRKDLLKNTPIYKDLNILINKSKNNEISLAVFKPTEIIDFVYEAVDRVYPKDILNFIENQNDQQYLFEDMKREIDLVQKLPYKFSYKFKDINGKESKIMIEDWELGQLFWNCFKKYNTEQEAVHQVIKKYQNFINQNDLSFFVGTTRRYHGWANNPFVIIGVFYPLQRDTQLELL